MWSKRHQVGATTCRLLAGVAVCGAALAGLGVFDCGTAAAAPVQALVGFQINSVDVDPLFLFDNQGTDSIADDTLTAGAANVDFSLKIGGSEQMFNDASFEFDAVLVDISSGSLPGTTVYELLFDGSFSFREDGTGDLILTAAFNDARLLMLEFADSGAVGFATGLAADDDDNVTFTLGAAVPAYSVTGAEQFQFTVNSLKGAGGGTVGINDSLTPPQFENFTFSSSFSGSMLVVPEPGTSCLAMLGLLWLVVCRYRRI